MVRVGVAGVPVDGSNVTREELGQQLVEGVNAVGTDLSGLFGRISAKLTAAGS